jgi:hypothetical protein
LSEFALTSTPDCGFYVKLFFCWGSAVKIGEMTLHRGVVLSFFAFLL